MLRPQIFPISPCRASTYRRPAGIVRWHRTFYPCTWKNLYAPHVFLPRETITAATNATTSPASTTRLWPAFLLLPVLTAVREQVRGYYCRMILLNTASLWTRVLYSLVIARNRQAAPITVECVGRVRRAHTIYTVRRNACAV